MEDIDVRLYILGIWKVVRAGTAIYNYKDKWMVPYTDGETGYGARYKHRHSEAVYYKVIEDWYEVGK